MKNIYNYLLITLLLIFLVGIEVMAQEVPEDDGYDYEFVMAENYPKFDEIIKDSTWANPEYIGWIKQSIMKEDETGYYLVFDWQRDIYIDNVKYKTGRTDIGPNIIVMKLSKDFSEILWLQHLDSNNAKKYSIRDVKVLNGKVFVLGINGYFQSVLWSFDKENGNLEMKKVNFIKDYQLLSLTDENESVLLGDNAGILGEDGKEVNIIKLKENGDVDWYIYNLLSTDIPNEWNVKAYSVDVYNNTIVASARFLENETTISSGETFYAENGHFLNIFIDLNSGEIIDVEQIKSVTQGDLKDKWMIAKFDETNGDIYSFLSSEETHIGSELEVFRDAELITRKKNILIKNINKILDLDSNMVLKAGAKIVFDDSDEFIKHMAPTGHSPYAVSYSKKTEEFSSFNYKRFGTGFYDTIWYEYEGDSLFVLGERDDKKIFFGKKIRKTAVTSINTNLLNFGDILQGEKDSLLVMLNVINDDLVIDTCIITNDIFFIQDTLCGTNVPRGESFEIEVFVMADTLQAVGLYEGMLIIISNAGSDTINLIANVLEPTEPDGFADGEDEISLKVFPNPTNEKFFIQGLEEDDIIKIYDLQGKLLFTKDANQEIEEFNLSGFNKGIYIVCIFRNSYFVSKRIFKI